ncbi:hypothetical protein [Curvibacter delicatus]|nr:hypothetical protein [Curvibacter delicatus]
MTISTRLLMEKKQHPIQPKLVLATLIAYPAMPGVHQPCLER